MKFNTVNLSDLTINLDGKRKPLNGSERNALKQKEIFPYCGANGIIDYIDEFIFDEEILCVAEDGGSWGFKEVCTYIMREPCWVNNHAHVLKAKENVDLKYLSYYLNYNDLNRYITGTTRGKLTKSALETIKINIPEIDNQRRIVTVLDKAQTIIGKRKAQIEALDQLTQSVFLEMFGEYLSSNFHLTELEHITEFIDYRGKTPTKSEKGVRLITAKNVGFGEFKQEPIEFISEELYEKRMTRGFSKVNDILFVTEGATLGNLTRIPSGFDRFSVGQRLITLVCKEDIVPEYLESYMLLDKFQAEIFKKTTGSSAKGIRSKELKKIDIVVPPFFLQEKYAKIIQKKDEQKVLLLKSLYELEKNYNNLIQRAFKGELFTQGKVPNV